MIAKFLFYLAATFVSGTNVDCSAARPWISSVYPDSIEVHKDSILYVNSYYAAETDVPGEAAQWAAKGTCDPTTIGDGVTIDCSSLPPWEAKEYTTTTKVAHVNRAWINPWVANVDETPSVSPTWRDQGVCGDGPAPTPAVTHTAVTNTAVTKVTGTTKLVTVGSTTAPPAPENKWPARYFAPFMDATLSKRPSFASLTAADVHLVSLGFVVGPYTNECVPTWGSYYTIPADPWYGFSLELKAFRQSGGDIMISFGGASNTELAAIKACQASTETLVNAYKTVVDYYQVSQIDFDIEGDAISVNYRDTVWKYRFTAVKQLTKDRPNLKVTWTFPVLPSGLLDNALTFVEDMMTNEVRFDRIMLMTMDFGTWACPGGDMSVCEIQAVQNVAKQVYDKAVSLKKAEAYGWTSVNSVYPIMGSCPMIGVNDVHEEIYTLKNAQTSLATWKSTTPIGWISMWSANRDSPCSGQWAQPVCSGGDVQAAELDYSRIFATYK